MKLSILIPTIFDRAEQYNRLMSELNKQKTEEVEIITDITESVNSGGLSIGTKRNRLLRGAKGKYVAFVDDDDMVSSDYVSMLLSGIEHDKDCISLRGVITWDGDKPELFEHSIKYSEYKTTTGSIKYLRYPNHLNCIRAIIAKRFVFPETSHGEDYDWATQIKESGLIKSEYFIDKILYHYHYISKK